MTNIFQGPNLPQQKFAGAQFAAPGTQFAGARFAGPRFARARFAAPGTQFAGAGYAGAQFAAKNHKGPNFPWPNLPRTAERHAIVDKQWLFVNFQMLTKIEKKELQK